MGRKNVVVYENQDFEIGWFYDYLRPVKFQTPNVYIYFLIREISDTLY